ncbi:MAG: 3-oxoacyl-ACP reductase [Acidimicrobiaceae bacterium TMED130]|nr:MAG: 3-oxoacyl-ACP reductase [Acidimicrobiaceae bacterium TMED130]|tara:strand:+ start:2652 stop:3434 length:783 start_codon:yes stop_codon:yes gene_type:complete
MGKLEGKVAVITASTRSIGRAIAETYLAEGAKVVISGRSEEKGAAALEEMNAGDNAIYITCDATKQEDVEGLIDGTVDHFGKIDIAVLNAGGILNAAPVVDMTDESWNYTLNLNLNHTFWGMRRALQHMIPQEDGRIIAISSVEGKMKVETCSHYTATKHAINGLVKTAAHEVGTTGVTVNAILPGFVMTDLFYESAPQTAEALGMDSLDEVADMYSQASAIKKPNTVEQVAAAALMFARDEARNLTACLFPVDGGTMPY